MATAASGNRTDGSGIWVNCREGTYCPSPTGYDRDDRNKPTSPGDPAEATKEARVTTPMRARKGALIGAAALCAAVGATSPVWAGTTGSPSSSPTRTHAAATSAQTAAITAMRAEITTLKSTLRADESALRQAKQADHAAADAAHEANAAAARWKHKAADTKTRIVTVSSSSASDDPTSGSPCHHHDGVDPGSWNGGHHDSGHHESGHQDSGHHDGRGRFSH
jgi:hypothetical protein